MRARFGISKRDINVSYQSNALLDALLEPKKINETNQKEITIELHYFLAQSNQKKFPNI